MLVLFALVLGILFYVTMGPGWPSVGYEIFILPVSLLWPHITGMFFGT